MLAGARGDKFAGFLNEETVRSKEWLGKADAAGVGVKEVEVWLEKFFGIGRDNVVHARRGEIFNRPEMRRILLCACSVGVGVRSGRALANGGAEVAAVAHEEKRSDGFEGVQKAEHAALAFTDGEGQGF